MIVLQFLGELATYFILQLTFKRKWHSFIFPIVDLIFQLVTKQQKQLTKCSVNLVQSSNLSSLFRVFSVSPGETKQAQSFDELSFPYVSPKMASVCWGNLLCLCGDVEKEYSDVNNTFNLSSLWLHLCLLCWALVL